MSKKEREREVNTNEMEKVSSQPLTAAQPATNVTEAGKESPSSTPGLLIFGVASESLCTDDGCFITFGDEKG